MLVLFLISLSFPPLCVLQRKAYLANLGTLPICAAKKMNDAFVPLNEEIPAEKNELQIVRGLVGEDGKANRWRCVHRRRLGLLRLGPQPWSTPCPA